MALQEFKCTRCEKKFRAPEWDCADGQPHEVEEKEYYVLDAPADRRDCRNSRLTICNVIPEQKRTQGNDIIFIPGTNVEFIRGTFKTSSPQIQMGLDHRKGVYHGAEGKKLWEDKYFSDTEKAEMQRIEMRSEMQRMEHQKNELLAQVQELTRKREAARA